MKQLFAVLLCCVLFPLSAFAQSSGQNFDVLIKGGTLYDGTGSAPRRADVGIKGDRIVAVGNLTTAKAETVVDASGLAVAPGFINMLSHSETSFLIDGRSMGELLQGVTTQILGEGQSMGPLSPEMKQRRAGAQGEHRRGTGRRRTAAGAVRRSSDRPGAARRRQPARRQSESSLAQRRGPAR